MSMTLDKLVARHGRYRAAHTAVICEDSRLSWSEFSRSVNRLSHALAAAGIAKGDKVATVLPNCVELLTLYWSITAIGAVVVPLSPLLQAQGLVNLLRDSDSRMVFLTPQIMASLKNGPRSSLGIPYHAYIVVGDDTAGEGAVSFNAFMEAAPDSSPPRADLQPDDLFNIVYSSGTTGLPKGIEHSHLIRSQYGAHFAASFRMTPESVVLHSGSIVFNGAFVTLMPAFFLGATYVLEKTFDVGTVIRTIQREKVSHTMMVPAQIIALLESPECNLQTLQSLEMILSLGAPLDQYYKNRLNELLPGRLYELYGLTEGFVTILDKSDFGKKSGSVGCPPPGYEIRIVDDAGRDLLPMQIGEIVGRGPILMPGYYGREDLTRQTLRDGWLFTGDLGYLDEDGYLFLSGRKKELIISGGVNVYPIDIEAVIIRHPAVVETAVFGIDSEKWGETPVAAIVIRDGHDIATEEMKNWINSRVEAKYQQVSDIFYIEEFPRNVAGKVLKDRLKDIYFDQRTHNSDFAHRIDFEKENDG